MNCLEETLQNVDIRTVDSETLADLNDVAIDPSMPRAERLKSYLEQIRNPYCFRCGKLIVKITYSDEGPALEEKIQEYLDTL